MHQVDTLLANMRATRRRCDMGDEIHSNESVWCPHCGHEHRVVDDFCLQDDLWAEGSWDMECEACGEQIEIETQASYTWITTKPEE